MTRQRGDLTLEIVWEITILSFFCLFFDLIRFVLFLCIYLPLFKLAVKSNDMSLLVVSSEGVILVGKTLLNTTELSHAQLSSLGKYLVLSMSIWGNSRYADAK